MLATFSDSDSDSEWYFCYREPSYVMKVVRNASTEENATTTITATTSPATITTSPLSTTSPTLPTTVTTTACTPTIDIDAFERNQTIIAYYKTYDVMTGVRIAATLGGFFGLMVILVLYKSKSKTEKALEDPDFTAAAVADAEEEEERQLAAVLEAASYQQLNPRRARRSLDTSSTPPGWARTATRFSSVGGGYSSLMEPPTRAHSRLPCFLDEDSPPEEDRSLYDDVYYNGHLDVPRRSSNITCSSSGSSYLERRDSAVGLGLPPIPRPKGGRRRQSSPLLEIYDFYYPIDIKVIQPTPGGSPCGSERALHAPPPGLTPRLAPLASISSCNSSLGTDCPDMDASYMSDSVFHCGDDDDDDDDDCEDTDDEVEPFSTDSEDAEGGSRHVCHQRGRSVVGATTPSVITLSRSSLTLVENLGEIDHQHHHHHTQVSLTDSDGGASGRGGGSGADNRSLTRSPLGEPRSQETLF